MKKRNRIHNQAQNVQDIERFNKEDIYGICKQEMEVDTNVNEDPKREEMLDQSVTSFLESLDEK